MTRRYIARIVRNQRISISHVLSYKRCSIVETDRGPRRRHHRRSLMRSSSEFLHTFIAIALTAPILVFYLVIAGEAFGYGQPVERLAYVAPSSIGQICAAMAKGTKEALK